MIPSRNDRGKNCSTKLLKKKKKKKKEEEEENREKKKQRKKTNFVRPVDRAAKEKNGEFQDRSGTQTGDWTETEITRDTGGPVKRNVALSRASTKLSHPLSSIFARLFRSQLAVSPER